MTIHDPKGYEASLWDWECLRGCFGKGSIKPMDIDGAVERNGKFLFIETKGPGVPLKAGQFIFYRRLTQLPGVAALLVWGYPGEPSALQIFAGNGISKVLPSDLDKLRRFAIRWYELAEQGLDVVIRPEDLEPES